MKNIYFGEKSRFTSKLSHGRIETGENYRHLKLTFNPKGYGNPKHFVLNLQEDIISLLEKRGFHVE